MNKVSKDKKEIKKAVNTAQTEAEVKEIFNRDAIKVRGFQRFAKSFGYSLDGLKYAYKYEQSMLIHVIATIAVIIANLLFRVTGMEWLITLLAIGMVLAAELINTAIEAVVDLVTEEYHPLAKVAKDTSAAAVLVFAIVAIIVGLIIFVPKIIGLF